MKVDLNPANYDPEKWAAIERLRHLQVVEGFVMKTETLEFDHQGRILLDSNNLSHRKWLESD